jgi:hypothetical protein
MLITCSANGTIGGNARLAGEGTLGRSTSTEEFMVVICLQWRRFESVAWNG